MLTEQQKIQAAERGAEWGRQEAKLQVEAVENGHQRTTADWTTGTWCGSLPHDSTDIYERTDAQTTDRDEYEAILDRAAQVAYEAAIQAAQEVQA
jgi:hypothetical protein